MHFVFLKVGIWVWGLTRAAASDPKWRTRSTCYTTIIWISPWYLWLEFIPVSRQSDCRWYYLYCQGQA